MPRIKGPNGLIIPVSDMVAEALLKHHDHQLVADEPAPAAAAPATGTSEVPEGAPSEKWTAVQLKAYAAAHNIELAKGAKKDEVLAALTTPATANTGDAEGDGGQDDTEQE